MVASFHAAAASCQLRVGTFNIRCVNKNDKGARSWGERREGPGNIGTGNTSTMATFNNQPTTRKPTMKTKNICRVIAASIALGAAASADVKATGLMLLFR